MQDTVHRHIIEEVRANTTTDTIFILAAIGFNFVMLCIGSSAAALAAQPSTNFRVGSIIVYVITLLLTLLVNGIAVIGLVTGRSTRRMLVTGLEKMYQDNQVSQYYDSALLTNYSRRYVLFIGIVLVVALAALAIPLVILVFTGPVR